MKNKIFAFFLACAFILNVVGLTSADTKPNKNQANQLAALLPASDGVITLDAKRFLSSALPQILSGNKPALDEINGKIDDFKIKTGIDARQFKQVAVGVSNKQTAAKKLDLDAVVLARGSFSANAVAATAKIASEGKYREEKIGGRTVYIFSPKDFLGKNKPTTANNSGAQKIFDKILGKLPTEFAVTAYDENTLAFGSLVRVRETLEAKNRLSNQMLSLVNRKQTAVMSFAANLPNGMADFVSLDDDEIGRNLNSIRQLYGTTDVVGENTQLSVIAKTADAKAAEALQKNLSDLREVGKALLGSSKGADKKVYGRMLENAKISVNGSEVMLDLQVPQSDINVLIGAK